MVNFLRYVYELYDCYHGVSLLLKTDICFFFSFHFVGITDLFLLRSSGTSILQQWILNIFDGDQPLSTFTHYLVQFSCSVVSDSLRPHELQHARLPCPSPTPGVHSNSCPLNWWCHPAISSSVIPFSSCSQSLPTSESFPMSQLFAWGGQSIGVSALASVLPMNTQGWSPLKWTGWISL